MAELGRLLIVLGVVAIVIGLGLTSGLLSWLGKLPGDIIVQRDHWSIYFPIATSIVLSIVLTLVLRLLGR
jgi:hypothetical protein